MFPLWAHAYSHRMMTRYECGGTDYNFDISDDIEVDKDNLNNFVNKDEEVIS